MIVTFRIYFTDGSTITTAAKKWQNALELAKYSWPDRDIERIVRIDRGSFTETEVLHIRRAS